MQNNLQDVFGTQQSSPCILIYPPFLNAHPDPGPQVRRMSGAARMRALTVLGRAVVVGQAEFQSGEDLLK